MPVKTEPLVEPGLRHHMKAKTSGRTPLWISKLPSNVQGQGSYEAGLLSHVWLRCQACLASVAACPFGPSDCLAHPNSDFPSSILP